jgi:hypothetical protein
MDLSHVRSITDGISAEVRKVVVGQDHVIELLMTRSRHACSRPRRNSVLRNTSAGFAPGGPGAPNLSATAGAGSAIISGHAA